MFIYSIYTLSIFNVVYTNWWYIFRYTPAMFESLFVIYPSGRWPSRNITNKFLTAGVYLTYTPLGHGLYITYIPVSNSPRLHDIKFDITESELWFSKVHNGWSTSANNHHNYANWTSYNSEFKWVPNEKQFPPPPITRSVLSAIMWDVCLCSTSSSARHGTWRKKYTL